MTSPGSPPPTKTRWQRLYTTGPITAAAVGVGWIGVYLIYQRQWLGFVFCVLTTVLSMVALRRGRRLASEGRRRLQTALERAGARNVELEQLRHLAATLLAANDVNELFREVAKSSSSLLSSHGSAISLVVEEGRFLKVVAASGILEPMIGTLVPSDKSLSGWV